LRITRKTDGLQQQGVSENGQSAQDDGNTPRGGWAVIVCSCNALRESQLREIARDGVRCEREAYTRLGCRPQCGQCLPYARQLVREESGRVAT
jgi:bacterioferritin-associated ferredoxin